MSDKQKAPTNLQIFLVVLIILGGIFVLYYEVFTKSDHEIVMNEFGDLEQRDNSFILPIQKLAMVVLPVVGLYYLIKSRLNK